ncbi:MAG: hypothetical protein HZA31_03605 [Opitutae bacterium]|nr:hypothetical protein [Opitutae bacterium]
MSGPAIQTDACVLLKRPPAEQFQTLTVFSAEHGTLTAMQRLTHKAANANVALDLFDDAALSLESSNQGQTWFVQEARVVVRRTAIGRSYDTLRLAVEFTTLVARNPVPSECRTRVAALLRQALDAFASAAQPELVHFKSLYCFARDEGYPVKQEWLPSLPDADRTAAAEMLRRPLAEQTITPALVTRLQRRLEDYLRGHTEIQLD